jgi:large-conductance mechanosensitive channel
MLLFFVNLFCSILILLVPYIADAIVRSILQADEFMGWNVTKIGDSRHFHNFFQWIETILSWNSIAQKVVSFILFAVVIPKLFDMIDNSSQRQARLVATHVVTANTTTTTNSDAEKSKDD